MKKKLIHFNKENYSQYIDRDFARDLWCVLGFPIDHTLLKKVHDSIDWYIDNNNQCILSTVNLNFSDCAIKNLEFRRAVNNSDICVIDGFPVLLVSKFLNIPIQERTSGSIIINHILRNKWLKKYCVYWFGSDEGIAKRAHEETNLLDSGNTSVGYHFPGYGDVTSMNSKSAIRDINDVFPDMLLLALSAKKGCIWIENNKMNINANIISHIGSVLDFFAGMEKESPSWTRKFGCEWLWKALLKPSLFKRFYFEGITFLKTLIFYVLPLKLLILRNKDKIVKAIAPKIEIDYSDNQTKIALEGVICYKSIQPLREKFKTLVIQEKNITIDCSRIEFCDNSFLGLLMLVLKYQQVLNKKLVLLNVNPRIRKYLKYNLIDTLFEYVG